MTAGGSMLGYRTSSWSAVVLAAAALGCSGQTSGAPSRGSASSKPKAKIDTTDAGSARDAAFFGNPGSGNLGASDAAAPPSDGSLPPFVVGSCGPGCTQSDIGAGTTMPFDPKTNPSEHVGVDGDGALVITRDQAATFELIWIANTKEGTVSKIDTNSYTELGRYTVPVDWNTNSDQNGPSRTSVDSDGNVYAGDRFGANLTKISAAGDKCPDTNGDGKITTSKGGQDVLPVGKDDCEIWSTDIGGDARGVAVQEIPTQYKIDSQPDKPPTVTEIPGARYVWTGGQEGKFKLHKIDAETGKILFTLDPPPAPTYGLAVDGRGNLWISGKNANSLGRIDTTRCVDATCQAEKVCVTQCSETSCPDTCDSAVLQRLDFGAGSSPYGITVDCAQRVWMGGAWGGNGVLRYDPLAPADKRLKRIDDTAFNTMSSHTFDSNDFGIHGIAADAHGWVWGAGHDTGVWRIDAETMQLKQVAGTGGPDFNAKGIAVDRRGRVWAIPLRKDYAIVVTPGMTIDDATVEKPFTGLVGPYTYSDMTGEQRRLASNDPGSYQQVFEGCKLGDKPTKWGKLSWDVEVPDGTLVVFLARTADSPAALKKAAWFQVTPVPGRDSPVEIEPFMKGAMQAPGRYLEIQVRLFTTKTGDESKDRCSSVPMITPRVKSFSVSHLCSTDLG
jgi:hypothetical protein